MLKINSIKNNPMYSNLIKGSIGAVGIVATDLVETAPMLQPEDISSIGNIIIQIVIAIASIFSMFKRRKKTN